MSDGVIVLVIVHQRRFTVLNPKEVISRDLIRRIQFSYSRLVTKFSGNGLGLSPIEENLSDLISVRMLIIVSFILNNHLNGSSVIFAIINSIY